MTLSFGIDTETTGPNYPLNTFNLNLLAKITPRSILHPLFHPDYQHTPLHPRILVRPSGTEALLRVMVEAKEESVAQEVAQRLAKVIENAQK